MEKGSARLEMSLAADGTLLIQIAGAWLLDRGAPTFDAFAPVLEKDKGMARAVYDASRLGDWDSAALSFLVQTSQALRNRGIAEDRSRLPTGLQRLIVLAQAVPERAGARSEAEREPLLARIGVAGIAVWDGIAEYLSFHRSMWPRFRTAYAWQSSVPSRRFSGGFAGVRRQRTRNRSPYQFHGWCNSSVHGRGSAATVWGFDLRGRSGGDRHGSRNGSNDDRDHHVRQNRRSLCGPTRLDESYAGDRCVDHDGDFAF